MTAVLIAGVSLAMQNPACSLRIHQRALLHPDGRTVSVGLRFDIPKHWHIYWRNPGDSGQATAVKWQTPQGWSLVRDHWTAPSRVVSSGITSYGFEGTADQWATFRVPAGLKAGQKISLKASSEYLICRDSCLPGEGSTSRTVTLESLKGSLESAANLPTPLKETTVLWDGQAYQLRAKVPVGRGVKAAYFYSAEMEVVEHGEPQSFASSTDGVSLTIPQSKYAKGIATHITGVLRIVLNDGSARSYSISGAAVSRRSLE